LQINIYELRYFINKIACLDYYKRFLSMAKFIVFVVESLATQKEVKLVDGIVEAAAVARGEEVAHRCLRSCSCALRPW
jgi:hypothetical protein